MGTDFAQFSGEERKEGKCYSAYNSEIEMCVRTSISARLRWFGAKKDLLEEREPLRCMAARIVFTFSIFANCNLMCKYGVSTRNDPAYTCVDAYVRTLGLQAPA